MNDFQVWMNDFQVWMNDFQVCTNAFIEKWMTFITANEWLRWKWHNWWMWMLMNYNADECFLSIHDWQMNVMHVCSVH
jgi:hypothetical protein